MRYLGPFLPELKYKDYQVYEAYHIGIGHRLYREYGLFAYLWCRNKNLILFALMSDGLAGRQATVKKVRDFRDPTHSRQEMSQTKGIRFATQISILMRWYSLLESNVRQQSSFHLLWGKLKQALLQPAYQKAAKEAPILNRLFLQEWDYAQALRVTRCSDYKEGGKPTMQLFGALMSACTDDDAPIEALQRMGQEIGYMIYLMTSVRFYRDNRRQQRYNIYLQRGMPWEAAVENAKRQCYQAATEMARSYQTLIILLHRELLENILIQGLEHAISQIGAAKEELL